jgi:hypothetical protein
MRRKPRMTLFLINLREDPCPPKQALPQMCDFSIFHIVPRTTGKILALVTFLLRLELHDRTVDLSSDFVAYFMVDYSLFPQTSIRLLVSRFNSPHRAERHLHFVPGCNLQHARDGSQLQAEW